MTAIEIGAGRIWYGARTFLSAAMPKLSLRTGSVLDARAIRSLLRAGKLARHRRKLRAVGGGIKMRPWFTPNSIGFDLSKIIFHSGA
jgi:hypothetical protein